MSFLSRRDYFAGMALAGLLADGEGSQAPTAIVKTCLKIADALIAELGEEDEQEALDAIAVMAMRPETDPDERSRLKRITNANFELKQLVNKLEQRLAVREREVAYMKQRLEFKLDKAGLEAVEEMEKELDDAHED